MPSLLSVSESDLTETSKTRQCSYNDVILNTDDDTEIATVGEFPTENVSSEESHPTLTKNSNATSPSICEPLKPAANAKDLEKTEGLPTSASTPNRKKRRVSPNSDSGSKQKLQKKVNQMTLSSFFFQRVNNTSASCTPTKVDKETAVKTDSVELIASTSPPRKFTSTTYDPSLATTSKEDITGKNLNLDDGKAYLDTDIGHAQMRSRTLEVAFREKGMSRQIAPLQNNDAGGEEMNNPRIETNLKHENLDCSTKTLAASLETEATSEPSPINTAIVIMEVAAKKKKKSRPTHSVLTTPVSKKKLEGSNTTKAKQSASTKKSISPESHATIVTKKVLSVGDLSEESSKLLKKYSAMKNLYLKRAQNVTRRHKEGLNEEDLCTARLQPVTDDTKLKPNDANYCEEFPTQVVTNMALLIEGSDLPLSSLVSKVCSELESVYKVSWSTESVSAKIKIMSKRKAYFDPIKKCSDVVDLFEDNNQDRLWRWEVTTLELLDSKVGSNARKARTARKKVSSYQMSLLKLVKSLEDTEKQILDPSLPKLDKAKAKVSRDEEKVLKFEREAEKQRLEDESRARKVLEQQNKMKAKEEAKRRKKEEAAEKKKETAQAREDEKRRKIKEKLQKEEEKKMQETKLQETAVKQKATFRSFFAAPKKEVSDHNKKKSNSCTDNISGPFDVELFRSRVDASTDVPRFSVKGENRSASFVASRKRRTKKVLVSVYKTVTADDADWGTPDYLEQISIKIPNRYRFLSFHEDCRPAYRGTWNKKSSIVTGKHPFGKDSSTFDYEYDSEAEWEEGDDEMGENVEDETKNEEDEMDGECNVKVYDFEDGFCVADDRLLDNEEDADEDTRALYKKKILNREHEQHMHSNRIRIIAPGFGGVPLHLIERHISSTNYVEGFDTEDVADVLSSFKGIQLSNSNFCADAFPQFHINEDNRCESNTNGNANNKNDYSVEAIVALARFSHHSTYSSKDKLIEDLRTSHPILFSNRAKAIRKLDSISIKKKHPKFAGVFWEVKREILNELGLNDIMEKKVDDILYDSSIPDKLLPSCEDHKSKNALNEKDRSTLLKNKLNDESTKSSKSASKKRKTMEKHTPEQKNAVKKKTSDKNIIATSSASQSNVKKESPKKNDESASMKNLMAQFVKRSSVKNSTSSPNNASSSSSSQ